MTPAENFCRYLVEGENLSPLQASVSPFLEVETWERWEGRLSGWGCWKLRSRSCWKVQRRLGK